jgi:capsular exopolysaccharide synthesis family protein
MSRIFDALQRLGTEQSGIEYPDMVSVATEVFEAPLRRVSVDQAVADQGRALQELAVQGVAVEEPPVQTPFVQAPVVQPAVIQEPVVQADAPVRASAQEKAAEFPVEFPSLEVSVTPASRLVYFTEPESLAAEKFRFLGVRLRQLQQTRPLKKVLVTSTIPEEGKSLVSANLAGVLARRKQRVLLIEGDMRRPTLAQQFGLGRLAGLAEWLQSGQQTPSNIYRLGGPDLWLLPAGHPPANPLELMQSGRLSQLMKQLASLFDWIIVDSPPLLPLADTTVWARMTDGVLLVAREGMSEKTQLERGLEILKKSDLLGVVLNGCSDHRNYYQRYTYQRYSPGTK